MSGAWKQRERLVAGWFGTRRNPLSGRNNFADNGKPRLGDVIMNYAVVEVKRRKTVAPLRRAHETRALASANNLPWVHIEFETGQADMCAIVVDFEMAEKIAKFMDGVWKTPKLESPPTSQT